VRISSERSDSDRFFFMVQFIVTRPFRFISILLFASFSVKPFVSNATQLSSSLTEAEVKQAADILGFGSVHKSWTAHALPGGSLGLDLGFESSFVFRNSLGTQGDGSSVIPRIIPIPRVWFSWDLPAQFMFSGSFAPGMLFDGITQAGFAVQWTFERVTEWNTSVSVLTNYTISSAFGDLRSQNFGFDLQFSRDLLAWQPYLILGFNMMGASVASRFVESGVKTGNYLRWAHHIAFGARIDFLAKLSVQMDLYNFKPGLGVLLSTSF
jgi:hypothetical protein